MTHQDYFNLLPIHIQKQLLENMKRQGKDSAKYFSEDTHSYKFIDYALAWSDTEEGSSYWSSLDNLFRDDRLPTPEDFEEFYTRYPEQSKRDQIINSYAIY